ncbi:NADH-quinone oxidoreductase subunit L, partial [Phenylobacterium sp.]|uniref:NADH-quinone oxidoreductase subunit L n=1 Tax=Phenylobacterium sp. TaxID=1871053 RepID=UPI0027280191
FTFAMLMLVTADNFLQMFFGWEGVGLMSYLLIGFWYTRPSANAAAIKAFVVNRVGDFGFALGIFAAFMVLGHLGFDDAFAAVAGQAGKTIHFLSWDFDAMTVVCLLLFMGAMGKSAQFLLHTWLPDAMEGPTPVSALIHAATMVTAGVFMVARLSPMFDASPFAMSVVFTVGAITAFFAATVGLVQNDIKRVIAYSTCSQLGYMFVAAGVGVYPVAMFHLFTHAFFKALLVLAAGSVIHAMHHEQDMRKMGGLWKYLPVTYAVMTIGTLAITGFGIPGVELGFAGFYSKDTIIESAFAAGQHNPVAFFAFLVSLSAAGLTAFYSWRLAFMTFHGTPKWEHHADDHAHAADAHAEDHAHAADDHGHGDHKPHESPLVMLVPLIALAVGAVAAGYVFVESFVGEERDAFWRGAIFNAPTNTVLEHAHHSPEWLLWAPLVVSVIGFLAAWYYYIANEGMGARIAAKKGPLWSFLYNKWYFDELYEATFVRAARFLGDLFWKGGDQKIIDGLGPDGVSAVSYDIGRRAGLLQTGYVYHYAFVMLLGVLGLLTFAVFQWQA